MFGFFMELRQLALAEARDALGVEAGERFAVALALVEDRRPGQSGLCTFEDQELELRAVVPRGHAPLGVVIADVQVVALHAPGTTNDGFCDGHIDSEGDSAAGKL